MDLRPWRDEQLNYLKFASIVLDELPKALRQTFRTMWDKTFGHLPGFQPWDDSLAVRNLFVATEGGRTKVPTNLSYDEWDSIALFEATIYAQSFAFPDSIGHFKTLSDLYVKPRRLPPGSFHPSVISPAGNQIETFALAIDQLRLLRNSFAHSVRPELSNSTFDHYVQIAKDVFAVLGVNTNPIDEMTGEKLQESQKKLQESEQMLSKIDADTQLPPSLLPSKVPNFIGRQTECDEIIGHLASQSTQIVSILGPPGIGKTALAVEVGHRLSTDGLHVYLLSLRNCQSKADLVSEFLDLSTWSRTITNPDHLSSSQSFDDELFQFVSELSQRSLFILDNADGLLKNGSSEVKDEVIWLLKEILRRSEKVAFIVTSRESLESLNVHFQRHHAIMITSLDELSSEHLVRELLPSANSTECQKITKICGNVPLAMKLFCSLVSDHEVTTSQNLTEAIFTIVDELEHYEYTSTQGLQQLFESAFQRLSTQEKEALASLCTFPKKFGLKAAAAVLGTTIANAKDILRQLQKMSLLDSSSEPESFYIHRLIKSFAGAKKEFQKVPSEILARGPLAVEVFNKALKEGTTYVKRVAVMCIGQERTGKTSLTKSLKGQKFDPKERTTEGIETDPSHFKVTTEILRTGEKNEENNSQSALSFEHHAAQYTAKQIQEKSNPRDVAELSTTFGDQESSPRITDLISTKEASTETELSFPTENKNKDGARTSVAQLLEPQVPEPQLPDPQLPKDIAELIAKLLQKVEEEEDDEEDIYSILWDFGGQSVYYTTHPIFLTEKAIYLLVCDLSQNPYDKGNPPVRKGLYKNTVDSFCSKTSLDYLEFWMSSVYSLVNPDAICHEMDEDLAKSLPPVFLVCTHADKPYRSSNNPRELALEIFGFLQGKIYSKHLHEDVFVVDNTKSGSEQECPEVGRLKEELREVAQKMPHMKEAIPIRWLKYEKVLKEMCKEGFKWIPLNQATEIALGACQIADEEEFQTLLNFLHDQRILIHFKETPELNQMVVLDPQWLIDVFKKVITVKPYDPQEKSFKELWLKLETTGILDAELLDHVWSPLFDNRETRESLVAIMERFSLLCPWPSSYDSKQYLVPSMLTSPPTDEVLKRPASAQLPSLFVKFDSGRVPPGLFPRLVLQLFQWSNEEWKNQMTPELFENFALFHIRPVEGISIKLLCHPSSIEVIVDSENVPKVNEDPNHGNLDVIMTTAHYIRWQLGSLLDRMRNKFFWLKYMKFQMCVCCPVCSPRGSVNYCRAHHVEGCKQDECLHFWTESELHECQHQFVICTRPGICGIPKIHINHFALWFTFDHGQQNLKAANQCSRDSSPSMEKSISSSKRKDFTLNPCVKQGTPMDDELEELGVDIAQNWMHLGRRLGVKDSILQGIHQSHDQLRDKGYSMLQHWKQKEGSAATYQRLCDALAHKLVQRLDLAEQFCYIDGSCEPPPKRFQSPET